jgi:O-antigen/teichoic acid export membrane protein
MVASSVSLIAGKAVGMGLGFLFWLLAAHSFEARAIGLTGAAISALMLCVQLATLGVGPAFIAEHRRHRENPGRLLDTALSIQILSGVVVAAVFLAIVAMGDLELGAVAANPAYAGAFLIMGAIGTVGLLQDHVSMAHGRGDHVLARDSVNGAVTLLPLAFIPLVGTGPGSAGLFSAWVIGALCACALGFRQIQRISGHRFRLRPERSLSRRLVGRGLPNYALTLTERAPTFVLPIIVTELLSPADNAYWYAAWMMSYGVYVIPSSLGFGLFAEVVRDRQRLAGHVRRALRTSLALGVPAAIGAAVLARPLLSLLGSGYADAGAAPLRILVVAVVPIAVIHTYFAVCRAGGQLSEAVGTGSAWVALGLGGAAIAVGRWGLVGMAECWLAATTLTAVWAAFRLRSLVRDSIAPLAVAPHPTTVAAVSLGGMSR